MLKAVTMYFRLIRTEIQAQMQYRVSLLMDILSTGMFSMMELLSFVLVMQRFGSLAGWSMWEVAFLFSLGELSFGWMDMIFSGFDPDFFAPFVRMGSLDRLLLKPVNLTLQILGSRFVLRRFGRIITGLATFLICVSQVEIAWTVWKVFYLLVIVASQVMTFGALFIIGSTITFWTVERIEAMNIVTYGGKEVISYPMSIYPRWLRLFYTFIVPFLFINYYPAMVFLDKPDPLGMPAFAPYLAPFVGIWMLFLALKFWRYGLTKYQSTGS